MTDRGTMSPRRQALARAVSILAHPAVVMLAATGIAAGSGGHPPALLWQALAAVVVAAAAVMLYSMRQARSGRWSHIDASQKHERTQLNRFASWLLLGLAGALALAGAHPGIVAAIGLSGLVVLTGHLLRARLKSSLHVAFAVFAACIAWPQVPASVALLLAAVAVAWSRLVLGRHVVNEVLSGAAIGFAAGMAFQALANR